MIRQVISIGALVWVSTTGAVSSKTGHVFPVLKGPYMGQPSPGKTAEPFAPGIISKDGWQIQGVFSPDLQEFYFTTDSGEGTPIIVIGFRQRDGIWKKYTEFTRDGEITFSPDGNRMYMAEGYVDRKGDGWTDRKSLGPMFEHDNWNIMRLSASAQRTYVFDDSKSKNAMKISRIKKGKRQDAALLGIQFNSGELTAHPYIAPDESYIIWDSIRDEGYGAQDLYISFRQGDGEWGPAINMGHKVNTDKGETYASVTSDGKYLLFNRRIDAATDNTDIYWVDASFIEDLKAGRRDSKTP